MPALSWTATPASHLPPLAQGQGAPHGFRDLADQARDPVEGFACPASKLEGTEEDAAALPVIERDDGAAVDHPDDEITFQVFHLKARIGSRGALGTGSDLRSGPPIGIDPLVDGLVAYPFGDGHGRIQGFKAGFHPRRQGRAGLEECRLGLTGSRSARLWAFTARYQWRPPLAATSRQIVEGAHPRLRAISERDAPHSLPIRISSRSSAESGEQAILAPPVRWSLTQPSWLDRCCGRWD